jgi:hypothetical protein
MDAMRTSKTAVWVFALVFLASAQAGPARESDEPPQLFILEVGAKEVPVQLGRAFTVDLDGKKVAMNLRVLPHRVFEAGGVRFSYPRHFTFGYEKREVSRCGTSKARTRISCCRGTQSSIRRSC